jgi:Fe-S-cluster-containing hydrogenase component 2
MCLEVCPHEVLELEKGKVKIADLDACMECGACALNCPQGAISVQSGVGCAAALIMAKLKGSATPECGCGDEKSDAGAGKCCG